VDATDDEDEVGREAVDIDDEAGAAAATAKRRLRVTDATCGNARTYASVAGATGPGSK